jgi:outer membrane lipoprotein SlyB
MRSSGQWIGCLTVLALATLSGAAWAQSRISYGRITAVNLVTQESARAQTGGALIGGALGIASGSGQSGSNRALRAIGGGFAGQQIGRIASQSQAFEYTILIGGTSTIRMVTDEAGLRVGDCVAVEQGSFNNLRLVADTKCSPPARAPQAPAAPRAAPTQTEAREANACAQAKEQLLKTEDQEAFDRAERRVRLLCAD